MRRTLIGILALMLPALAGAPAGAALLSKTFQFKPDVTLTLGSSADNGLRVDTVHFRLPSSSGRQLFRLGGGVQAEIAVSNSADRAQKVGIAIALFDPQGRLLAVASGGSELLAIKPDRQSTYTLVFKDVNNEAHNATSFQISIEAK